MLRRETERIRFPALLFEEIPIPDMTTGMRLQNDKLEFVGQIFTAPLPPAFMRGARTQSRQSVKFQFTCLLRRVDIHLIE